MCLKISKPYTENTLGALTSAGQWWEHQMVHWMVWFNSRARAHALLAGSLSVPSYRVCRGQPIDVPHINVSLLLALFLPFSLKRNGKKNILRWEIMKKKRQKKYTRNVFCLLEYQIKILPKYCPTSSINILTLNAGSKNPHSCSLDCFYKHLLFLLPMFISAFTI